MSSQKKDDTVIRIVIGVILGFFIFCLINNSETNSSFNWSDDDALAIINQTNEGD